MYLIMLIMKRWNNCYETVENLILKDFLIMRLWFILLLIIAGNLDYTSVISIASPGQGYESILTIAVLLLFGGAISKSAQAPFHT